MNIKTFNKYYLYLTVFLVGAVILIIEITGTRIVAPFFGTTVYVWSSLIGVTLMALTAGYFIGGWLSDRKPSSNWLFAVILLTAVPVFIIQFISAGVLQYADELGPKMGSLAGAAVLFVLPLLLLGIVSPYAVKISVIELKDAGKTAGTLYGISTIGSFLGAISAGFYLIPFLGIRAILDIMTAVLILLPSVWYVINWKKWRVVVIVFVSAVLLLLAYKPRAHANINNGFKVLCDRQTRYSRLKIIETPDNYRFLFMDNALQTVYNASSNEFSIGYISMFEKAISMMPSARHALVIGLGGGGISTVLAKHGLEVDNVEVDPVIAGAASEFFGFSGKVIIDDGRHYVRNHKQKYDLIFLDAYNGFSIYQYMLTKEAFAEMADCLSPGGILTVNTVGKLSIEGTHGMIYDRLTMAVVKTLSSVFKNTAVKADSDGICNFVYYASAAPFIKPAGDIDVVQVTDGELITDDRNCVDNITSGVIEKWRKQEMKNAGRIFLF